MAARCILELFVLIETVVMALVTGAFLIHTAPNVDFGEFKTSLPWYLNFIYDFGYVFIFFDNIGPIVCGWIRGSEVTYSMSCLKTVIFAGILATYVGGFFALPLCDHEHVSLRNMLIANLVVLSQMMVLPIIAIALRCRQKKEGAQRNLPPPSQEQV
jgi:hypothetical protein